VHESINPTYANSIKLGKFLGARIHLAFGVTAQAKSVDYTGLITVKSAHNLCH